MRLPLAHLCTIAAFLFGSAAFGGDADKSEVLETLLDSFDPYPLRLADVRDAMDQLSVAEGLRPIVEEVFATYAERHCVLEVVRQDPNQVSIAASHFSWPSLESHVQCREQLSSARLAVFQVLLATAAPDLRRSDILYFLDALKREVLLRPPNQALKCVGDLGCDLISLCASQASGSGRRWDQLRGAAVASRGRTFLIEHRNADTTEIDLAFAKYAATLKLGLDPAIEESVTVCYELMTDRVKRSLPRRPLIAAVYRVQEDLIREITSFLSSDGDEIAALRLARTMRERCFSGFIRRDCVQVLYDRMNTPVPAGTAPNIRQKFAAYLRRADGTARNIVDKAIEGLRLGWLTAPRWPDIVLPESATRPAVPQAWREILGRYSQDEVAGFAALYDGISTMSNAVRVRQLARGDLLASRSDRSFDYLLQLFPPVEILNDSEADETR